MRLNHGNIIMLTGDLFMSTCNMITGMLTCKHDYVNMQRSYIKMQLKVR